MQTPSRELTGMGVTATFLQIKTIDVVSKKVFTPSLDTVSWPTPEDLTAAILYLIPEAAGTVNRPKLPLFGSF